MQTPLRRAALFGACAAAALAVLTPNISYTQCDVTFGSLNCLGSGFHLDLYKSYPKGSDFVVRKSIDTLKAVPLPEQKRLSLPQTWNDSTSLLSLQMSEAYEEQFLQQRYAQISLHYAMLIITLGGGGTEDEESLRNLISEIRPHAEHLKSLKEQICRLQRTNCPLLTLQIIHNPSFEVQHSDPTYEAPPVYRPQPSPCVPGRTFGGMGCPVQ
jgi:hypothetical protein